VIFNTNDPPNTCVGGISFSNTCVILELCICFQAVNLKCQLRLHDSEVRTNTYFLRFEALTASSINMRVF
jgi:hypothetical protein